MDTILWKVLRIRRINRQLSKKPLPSIMSQQPGPRMWIATMKGIVLSQVNWIREWPEISPAISSHLHLKTVPTNNQPKIYLSDHLPNNLTVIKLKIHILPFMITFCLNPQILQPNKSQPKERKKSKPEPEHTLKTKSTQLIESNKKETHQKCTTHKTMPKWGSLNFKMTIRSEKSKSAWKKDKSNLRSDNNSWELNAKTISMKEKQNTPKTNNPHLTSETLKPIIGLMSFSKGQSIRTSRKIHHSRDLMLRKRSKDYQWKQPINII